MTSDTVAVVEIDEHGRLHLTPATQVFPWIHLEAMGISWSSEKGALGTPPPRDWNHGRWFQQIQAAALAQGVRLRVVPDTRWINVPASVKR